MCRFRPHRSESRCRPPLGSALRVCPEDQRRPTAERGPGRRRIRRVDASPLIYLRTHCGDPRIDFPTGEKRTALPVPSRQGSSWEPAVVGRFHDQLRRTRAPRTSPRVASVDPGGPAWRRGSDGDDGAPPGSHPGGAPRGLCLAQGSDRKPLRPLHASPGPGIKPFNPARTPCP